MARRGSTTTVTISDAVSVKATEMRPPAQVKMRTVVLITRAVQTRVRSAVIQPGTSAPEGGSPSAEEKVLLVAMRYPEEKRVSINVVAQTDGSAHSQGVSSLEHLGDAHRLEPLPAARHQQAVAAESDDEDQAEPGGAGSGRIADAPEPDHGGGVQLGHHQRAHQGEQAQLPAGDGVVQRGADAARNPESVGEGAEGVEHHDAQVDPVAAHGALIIPGANRTRRR